MKNRYKQDCKPLSGRFHGQLMEQHPISRASVALDITLGVMSKLGCPCGNTIRDNTSGLPYKASLLKDSLHESYFDWLVQEIQSYVTAVERGSVREWLMGRGYGEQYIALELDHGNVLHDHIHTKYLSLKRNVYECSACGRIHVETNEDNMFVAYAPDSGKNNGALFE